MARIDDAVRRILRVKFRAGLFEHPYVDVAKAKDAERASCTDADRAAARKAAGRSMVLLKNDGPTLPLDPTKKTAVIGPLGDDQHDMLGPWWGQGRDEDAVTVFTGIKAQNPNATFTQGCTMSNAEPPEYDPATDCTSDAGFADGGGGGQGGRPGRARARRDARDERRGGRAQRRSTCPAASRS